jgi:hypothetical protein
LLCDPVSMASTGNLNERNPICRAQKHACIFHAGAATFRQ